MRRARRTAGVALATGAMLALTTTAYAADTIFPDGDTGVAAPNLSYGSGGHACSTRGTGVDGSIRVNFNGQSASNHFWAGEGVTVSFAPADGSGITAETVGTVPDVPGTWGATPQDSFTIPFTTTVPSSLADGAYKVDVTVTGNRSGYSAGYGEGSGKPQYNVQVACTTTGGGTGGGNTAPQVAWTANPASANEGDVKTYALSITDPDANTWSFAGGYPSCGSLGTVVANSASVDQTAKTATFQCSFPDGYASASSTVAAEISDGTAASNELTQAVSIANLNPSVGALTIGGVPTGAACTSNNITLDFGFTDAGVNDADWAVDINWGDGSTHTSYNASTQGALTQRSHTYGAGTFHITVTVTDKDGGSGNSGSTGNNVALLYSTGQGILQPINYTGPRSAFKSGSTIPVKVKITDCNGAAVSSLSPQVSLRFLDGTPDGAAVEDFYSTVPDQGTTMRFTGSPDYQYIYNLGTKGRSSGDYTVTVSDASIAPISATFSIKK
jgi:hypothetical protein